MKNDGEHCVDISKIDKQWVLVVVGEEGSSIGDFGNNGAQTVVTVVISNGELGNQVVAVLDEGMDHFVLIAYRTSSAAILLAPIAYFWERVMKNDGEHCVDISKIDKQGVVGEGGSSMGDFGNNGAQTVVTVVISNSELGNHVVAASSKMKGGSSSSEPKLNVFTITSSTEAVQVTSAVSSPKKASLSRNGSGNLECRVCQQQAEEALIDLGCHCRGGLAKAHRSCIDTWFLSRGSNKCEICQQVAINVPPPETQPSRNYWVWRVDPAFRGPSTTPERERGCYSPLWVAFSILIGGLLLDVLISISLGVSALPVNIIIGVLVVLGLGTALRLALECCHELSLRRAVQIPNTNVTLGPLGYHPTV
ncbi:hypothetical protein IFM89_013820 [Coptis chinensis]|uniref:RING-CH-type domain-containing protein n=1 Tax=Coptis chinensis TaxID=261450 RepID=A0A835HPV0_9MAGN|nr:hypothetical protein IFM89_013820 [Coptis chinensis]